MLLDLVRQASPDLFTSIEIVERIADGTSTEIERWEIIRAVICLTGMVRISLTRSVIPQEVAGAASPSDLHHFARVVHLETDDHGPRTSNDRHAPGAMMCEQSTSEQVGIVVHCHIGQTTAVCELGLR